MSFDSELARRYEFALIEKWKTYSRGRLLEFEETT
jgi:hypothetical protein